MYFSTPKHPVAACAFLICSALAGYADQYGDFTYVEYNTYIEITFYPRDATGVVVIPNEIVGKPVTSIGDWAFGGCSSLTSVTIPHSVASIGIVAFTECSNLTSVTIGNGVTSIEDWAFSKCSSLTSVTIPDSVTSLGLGAFGWCSSLTSVTIGSGVTSIRPASFAYCDSLTTVTIPDSVTTIGQEAFAKCSSLTNLKIGSGVTSIGDGAFYTCSSLTTVTIPDNVTSIGVGAFDSCSTLTNVTIGSGVTSIGKWTFYNCSGLSSVTIPDSVTTIGQEAFAKCSSLTNLKIGSGVTSIGDGAFYTCSSLTTVTIPDSVTSIGEEAFVNCSNLTSVTIGSGVAAIGKWTFYNCSGLSSVYFEGNAPNVGPNVFEGANDAIVYYLPGTTGWGATFGGRPTALTSGPPVDPVVEILQPPQSYTAAPRSSATFKVLTSGIEGESYEWKFGDAAVGGNSATLILSNVQASDAGQYTVTVTAGEESVSSRAVTLGVKALPYTEKMMNISTRGQILTGTKVMIAGFVLAGTGQKDVLIRGIGPKLEDFGINGLCTDPMLTLFRITDPATPPIAENDDWGSLTEDIPGITGRVGGFPLPDGSKDAVLYMNLDTGAYTARVSGLDGTGVGLVELYDADLDPPASTCNLANISTRGEVGLQAQVLIAGFVVAGEVPKQVLVRGIGPRLADFQVDGTLADPYLRIVKNVESGQLWVASNDNWSDNPNAADIVSTSATVGAFDLVEGSNDAVMLTWLEPGVYTAQVSGVGETTGVALAEVYEVK